MISIKKEAIPFMAIASFFIIILELQTFKYIRSPYVFYNSIIISKFKKQ